MNSPRSVSTPESQVLIFGSQALNFGEESARQLRSNLLDSSSLSWALDALLNLSSHWAALSEAIPALKHFPGETLLNGLKHWLRTGSFGQINFTLHNTLLTPLVVVSHLAQYSRFLDLLQFDHNSEFDLPDSFKYKSETLGLCTGLLSAAAASCSPNRSQLRQFGAVAVRLAMLVGALVDAQEALADLGGDTICFSLGWSSPHLKARAIETLESFSGAYISVLSDDNRATLTADKSIASALEQKLKTAGLSIARISLRGRFHSQVHSGNLEAIMEFVDSQPAFQFLDASQLVLPTRFNTNGDYVTEGKLHHGIIRAILVDQADWVSVFARIESTALTQSSRVIGFGSESCVPHSFVRKLGSRFIHLADLAPIGAKLPPLALLEIDAPPRYKRSLTENGIAVIGMSAHFAGADDIDELWQVLCSAISQHIEVPAERFTFETAWRDNDSRRKWYGNFIRDYDTFDHKFFRKSPREIGSTDPQHRLMLQAAYQAVEQSGYFNHPTPNKHIGCYVGVGLVDYERNIACAPATAYSATGNLKSFAAGKISHYFGWTGPGLTIDTACSSSAVAIHTACRAILSGEITGALVGGVNIMASPEWFQNLAGASFLSPTGQCKPFDVKGDGYCRGEGVGAVFLKHVSAAIADGDQILGIIASSGVYQNENCTPITVPNAPSLSGLFRDVIGVAGLEPHQISYVEAHGTGTAVGDPAEYDAIRNVLGGSIRSNTLSVGSVKGSIGHTESASGIAALLKTLLMIQEGSVPPQASFDAINPSINASTKDNMEVPKSLKPWDRDFRAALINNYGASGSNACLVVTQGPKSSRSEAPLSGPANTAGWMKPKYPIWFSGNDDRSLHAYSARFRKFLQTARGSPRKNISIENLAFQLSRQSNRTLPQSLIFSCSSTEELETKLAEFEQGSKIVSSIVRPPERPVILCFGGQISTFIGLDRQIYDTVTVLRTHLDECDRVCQSIGLDSLYPVIFQRSPIEDAVKLQTTLFAAQYSCAQSWIDCGVEIAAVIGFSFGELTALCVSGALSLQDTIRMVAGRAQLIQEHWGAETGAMMAIEADLATVEVLLTKASKDIPDEIAVSIACFNGPTSFTIAGSTKAIDGVAETAKLPELLSLVKAKRLNVTHAFHSTLVEPLIDNLEHLGKTLQFREPKIPIEHATEFSQTDALSAKFLANHMRNPVYFHQAVQRLSQRFGDCIWLEAGSNSTITNIASRALGSPKSFHFQPINISTESAFQLLVEATINLWKEGLNITFWPHHSSQRSAYDITLLPPYQFEKSKHWVELKPPPKAVAEPVVQTRFVKAPKEIWSFIGYQDRNKCSVRFQINTASEQFEKYVLGHIIAQAAPLCPSTLQLSISIDALMSLHSPGVQPDVQGLANHAPLSIDSSRSVWLEADRSGDSSLSWEWKMVSQAISGSKTATLHASGRVVFRSADDLQLKHELNRFERLIGLQRCQALLTSPDSDEVITGGKIYKRFSEIVEYSHEYRGLQKLVGKGHESAGRVTKTMNDKTWLNTGLADSFCQVAGVFLNLMTDRAPSDIYISDRIDRWIRSPLLVAESEPDVWDVFSTTHHTSEKRAVSDVYIFDPRNGSLVEAIIGIHYQLVSKVALAKVIAKFASGLPATSQVQHEKITDGAIPNGVSPVLPQQSPVEASAPAPKKTKKGSSKPDIVPEVRQLLCNLSGLEPSEIKDDSDLVDLGIDSLMAMELGREIDITFKCTMDTGQFLDLTDFRSLITLIRKTIGTDDEEPEDEDDPAVEPNHASRAAGTNGVNGVNGVNGARRANISHGGNDTDNINGINGANCSKIANGTVSQSGATLLPATTVLGVFGESKQATDRFITTNNLGDYVNHILPFSNELCIVHILDAFDALGCSIRNAKPGEQIKRIEYLHRHEQFVDWIYHFLEETARLIDINGTKIVRTAIAYPKKSAQVLLQDLVRKAPVHAYDHELTYMTGIKLADCLTGKADAIHLIFGSPDGREVVSNMYAKSPINLAWVNQMENIFAQLLPRVAEGSGVINILEMGAGTGGTTSRMIPLLASLNVPVQYTITDLSPSLVAAARKRFKDYPFIKFQVMDIEKSPPEDMLHSQHIVLATNCVHATHDLKRSTKNIHDVLRPDGFLIMLEMTQPLPWVDLVFGLMEGWWLFDDGRTHALAPPSLWEQALYSVGYGHVDWTDGNLPEAAVQRIIIALASGPRYDRAPILSPNAPPQTTSADIAARQALIDAFVHQHVGQFSALSPSNSGAVRTDGRVVLVTGATGSLGSHLVAHLVALPNVEQVICVNRPNTTEPQLRQSKSLQSRGISLDPQTLSKLRVVETDTAKPLLGLSRSQYEDWATTVTDIVHNAWPMSITRRIHGFASQFKVMQNLIELSRDVACRRPSGFRAGFQFISSIATVGFYPLRSGITRVPEERVTAESVLPVGYGDAKLVCERMLDETLHKYPDRFRPMVVRIGQIAGSTASGYWNPVEHFAFLVKSSQTLKALPDLDGELSWCPVTDVAATLGELLLSDQLSYAIYHIENPSRQSWREMILVLSDALNVPYSHIIPFEQWVRRVRQLPPSIMETDNPAAKIIDFLDQHFIRLSCGGLILDTAKSTEHSATLRNRGPVQRDLVLSYVCAWKKMGFLHGIDTEEL